MSSSTDRTLAQRVVYAVFRQLARLAGLLFFRLRCRGRHFIPRTGGVLVCANHQSVLDPVLVGLACNRRLNYLARRTLFRSRLFGAFIRFLDAIPIDREGLGIEGLRETLRRLRRGEMVLIFPEGTRTPDGELQPLKPGFFAVARRSGAALLPVAIDGAYQAWPRSRRLPLPTRVTVEFGAPIAADQVATLPQDVLLALLTERLEDCHAKARACRLGAGQ